MDNIDKKAKSAVMKLARATHKWGLRVLKDKKWMDNAGVMSKEMAHEYAEHSVKELAKKAYDYMKMRYEIAKSSGFHPAFASDVKNWEDIHKGFHTNTEFFELPIDMHRKIDMGGTQYDEAEDC